MSYEGRVLMIAESRKQATIQHNKSSRRWTDAENAFKKFNEGNWEQRIAMENAASRIGSCLAGQMRTLKEVAILVLADAPDARDVYHMQTHKAAKEIEPLLKHGLELISESVCIRKVTDFPKPLYADGAGHIIIRFRVEVQGPISSCNEYYPHTEQEFDNFVSVILREMLAPLYDFLVVTETITTGSWDE